MYLSSKIRQIFWVSGIVGVCPLIVGISWIGGWIDFQYPQAMFLFLLLPFFAWIAQHSQSGISPKVQGIALATRSLLVTVLILAIGNMEALRKNYQLGVYFLMDISASIGEHLEQSQLRWIREACQHKAPQDENGLIVFAKQSSIEVPLNPFPLSIRSIHSYLSRNHTNIQEAVQLAVASFPPHMRKKIVLFTDGIETEGNLMELLPKLRDQQIEMDVVPLKRRVQQEVQIVQFQVPDYVPQDGEVIGQLVVSALVPVATTIILTGNNQVLWEEKVQLQTGDNFFTLKLQPPKEGLMLLKVQLLPEEDTILENNVAWAGIKARKSPQALFISNQELYISFFERCAEILLNKGVRCDVVSPVQMPRDLIRLGEYDLICLGDVSAGELGEEVMLMLAHAVRELGCGLIVFGGLNSFALGGYTGTKLEEILPVEMTVRHRKIIPKGAIVLILHTCEFPDGNYWAKEICKATLGTLQDQDEIGLLYYSGGGESWLFPLTLARERDNLVRLINQCEPGDMPSFAPCFAMARKALENSTAGSKHIIVISDGDPTPPKPEDVQYLIENKITVSAVAINPHTPQDVENLQSIALVTRGRYYLASDPKLLPKIFTKEAQQIRRSAVQQKTIQPLIDQTSKVMTNLPAVLPLIHGYLITSPKPSALLSIISDENDRDPILATWQYGIGTVSALPSNLTTEWMREWVTWPYFQLWLDNLFSHHLRRVNTQQLQVYTSVSGDRVNVVVEYIRSENMIKSPKLVSGVAIDLSGNSQSLLFSPAGTNRYESSFKVSQSGPYLISVYVEDANQEISQMTLPISVPFFPEYARFEPNNQLFESISQALQPFSKLLPIEEENPNPFISKLPPAILRSTCLPILLFLLPLLFFSDIAIRRITGPAFILFRVNSEKKVQKVTGEIQRLARKSSRKKEVTRPSKFLPEQEELLITPRLEENLSQSVGDQETERKKTDNTLDQGGTLDYISRLKRAKENVSRKKQDEQQEKD